MNSSIYRSYGESSNSNVLRYRDDEIIPYPMAEQRRERPATLPILRIETASDVTYRPESATLSTSPQNKLYIGQKEYTDSLRRRNMTMFKENIQCKIRQKNGPSSPSTIFVAGLFVCGSFLLLSGLIVLIVHSEMPYIITGSIFTGVGTLMVIICGFLQRKNILKYFHDINTVTEFP